MKTILYAGALSLAALTLIAGEGHEGCAQHEQHMKRGHQEKGESASPARGDAHHGAAVDARHDSFGMSHQESRHNFRLFEDGGAIELRSVNPEDARTIEAIRGHLKTVVREFDRGDFTTPGFVHGHAPHGIETMTERKALISWKYEELPEGGRIRIRTADREALDAVHAFLKFQVTEHRTGDSGIIEKSR